MINQKLKLLVAVAVVLVQSCPLEAMHPSPSPRRNSTVKKNNNASEPAAASKPQQPIAEAATQKVLSVLLSNEHLSAGESKRKEIGGKEAFGNKVQLRQKKMERLNELLKKGDDQSIFNAMTVKERGKLKLTSAKEGVDPLTGKKVDVELVGRDLRTQLMEKFDKKAKKQLEALQENKQQQENSLRVIMAHAAGKLTTKQLKDAHFNNADEASLAMIKLVKGDRKALLKTYIKKPEALLSRMNNWVREHVKKLGVKKPAGVIALIVLGTLALHALVGVTVTTGGIPLGVVALLGGVWYGVKYFRKQDRRKLYAGLVQANPALQTLHMNKNSFIKMEAAFLDYARKNPGEEPNREELLEISEAAIKDTDIRQTLQVEKRSRLLGSARDVVVFDSQKDSQ